MDKEEKKSDKSDLRSKTIHVTRFPDKNIKLTYVKKNLKKSRGVQRYALFGAANFTRTPTVSAKENEERRED